MLHSCKPSMYTLQVHYGEVRDVPKPVKIYPFSDEQRKTFLPQTQEMGKKVKKAAPLKKHHPKRNPCYQWWKKRWDEVGSGSFGIVYKGDWAGTEVAVKQIKLRSPRCIRPVLETEVKLHSMIWHPNIVQIMAISFLEKLLSIDKGVHWRSQLGGWSLAMTRVMKHSAFRLEIRCL